MIKTIRHLSLATSIVLLGACASAPQLSEQEALAKFPAVANLSAAINAADQSQLALLSQATYGEAMNKFAEAKSLALKNKPNANAVAQEATKYFNAAQKNAINAQDVLFEVLQARTKAVNAGAMDFAQKDMKKLEEDFKEITAGFEAGNQDQAKVRRPEMIRRYGEVELIALKQGTVDKASLAIAKAKKADADDYAEILYKQAGEELELAKSLLDADKNSRAKAEQHAEKAIFLAEESMVVTDIVKEFKTNDFSEEEIVLWYYDQLAKATNPLGTSLPLNKPNHHLVAYITQSIADLKGQLATTEQERDGLQASLEKALSSSQNELASMKTRYETDLAKMEAERQYQKEMEAMNRQKLERIQSMFTANEANVYRQRDDILIRAHGFYFASGQSEIDSRNFSLLNKVAKVLEDYPQANIVITGHTDAQGDDATNLRLSEERAGKVAKFLNEVGNIPANRLMSEGKGEQNPVATNETVEGRASNRRVEFLIVNQ